MLKGIGGAAMKRTTIFLTLLLAAILVSLAGSPAGASKRIAELEGQQCTVCHARPGSKRLNDRGIYYEKMRTLDGYDEVIAAFSECTACHVNKAGSKKLTDRGRTFAFAVRDMEGLKQWLRESHPQLRGEPGWPQR
jgi:cytochrome c553